MPLQRPPAHVIPRQLASHEHVFHQLHDPLDVVSVARLAAEDMELVHLVPCARHSQLQEVGMPQQPVVDCDAIVYGSLVIGSNGESVWLTFVILRLLRRSSATFSAPGATRPPRCLWSRCW